MAKPLEKLRFLLNHIALYQEAATSKDRRKERAAAFNLNKYGPCVKSLHPVDIDLLWNAYEDLCRTGEALTSWTPIKEICEQCGFTVEPWDEISWTIKA